MSRDPLTIRRTWSLAVLVAAALSAPGASSALQSGSEIDESATNALREEGAALSDVTAKVDDGVIELSGSVESLAAKYLAEQAVAMTRAGHAIVNRIEVRAPERTASAIEDDYREMLLEEPATESFQIDAVARDGILVLTGLVDSPAERQLAETIGRRVRGVVGIDNNLQVRPSENRADAEIEEEIRSLLEWDARVDESLIAVSVRDGVVELAGVARTPLEKTQAVVLAHVEGVKNVEAPELLVRIEDDEIERARSAPAPAGTDEEVARALEKALTTDPRVPEETIQVEVRDGVAYLRGEVGRLTSKYVAGNDAVNVVGVVRVVNNIQVVDEGAELSDEEVRENVESALGHDPLVDTEDLDVTVEDGVVVLTGTVLSERERDRAIAAAARARGVLEVQGDQLAVGRSS